MDSMDEPINKGKSGISVEEYINIRNKIVRLSVLLIFTGEGAVVLFCLSGFFFGRSLILIYLLFAEHSLCMLAILCLIYVSRNKNGKNPYQINQTQYPTWQILGYNDPLFTVRYPFAFLCIFSSMYAWYITIGYLLAEGPLYEESTGYCLLFYGIYNSLAVWCFRMIIQPEEHGYIFTESIDAPGNHPNPINDMA